MIKKETYQITLKKIGKFVKYTMFTIVGVLIILALLSSILAVIFMIIRANNGHLSPWMLKIIEIEKQALRLWVNS